MSKSKFIVVSNRLPVTVSKQDGKLVYSNSSGGLATAMSSLQTETEKLWVGWPGIDGELLTPQEKRAITAKLRKEYGCIPVFLTAEQNKMYYEGFSNATIWPLFHYFQDIAEFNDDYWASYEEVNAQIAKTVKKYADVDSTIWIHDYHLMLLPALLKKQLPKAAIGFFLHIPFPSFEIFRLIPQRKEILEGLLGADLIGFHIYDYVRHFITSVSRTLGYNVRNDTIHIGPKLVKVDAFPISIDYDKFKNALEHETVQQELTVLKQHYGDKKIILSVDRLDYSKGIEHRLDAFETFLKLYPQYHSKVVLVVVAVPSRIEVQAYKSLRDRIELAVGRINGRYGSINWTPVMYQFQNQPFEKLVALYMRSSVALVTPVRDGMNLVAKEYIASKGDNEGVLILSELTGAVDELPEALIINPNDTIGVAKAIRQALRMPILRQKKHLKTMQRRIANNNVQHWANDFISSLDLTQAEIKKHQEKLLRDGDHGIISKQFLSANKRLIVLDYDGTLREFVASPRINQARPPRRLWTILKSLCADPMNDVYIISGRPRDALDSWFGTLPISLVAEHGYWVKRNGEWQSTGVNPDTYKSIAMPIMQRYTERTPGSILEDKTSSIVWHYRNTASELAYARIRGLKHDLQVALTGSEASVYEGNKILEVKPRAITKGSLITSLDSTAYDFILCIGDDYTDEDMFKVYKDNLSAVTVKVGMGMTSAKYQVRRVGDVLNILKLLV